MSLPSKSEIDNRQINPIQNSVQYPSFSEISEYPKSNQGNKGRIYEKPNQPPQPQNYGAPIPGNPQMLNRPIPNQPMPNGPLPAHGPMPMAAHGPMPLASPVYIPPPVPGAIPVYPQPYPVPYGVYPYPQYVVANSTMVILPPGYKRDYSPGYSPWGDLADDLNNLF